MSTSRRGLCRTARRPLPLALALFVGSLHVAGGLLPSTAVAQASAATFRFDIPAGPLAAALNRAGATAGVLLSFDPALVADLRTAGLQGSHGFEDALRRLLQGTGLAPAARGRGADAASGQGDRRRR